MVAGAAGFDVMMVAMGCTLGRTLSPFIGAVLCAGSPSAGDDELKAALSREMIKIRFESAPRRSAFV
jgi:hypothetical protein